MNKVGFDASGILGNDFGDMAFLIDRHIIHRTDDVFDAQCDRLFAHEGDEFSRINVVGVVHRTFERLVLNSFWRQAVVANGSLRGDRVSK